MSCSSIFEIISISFFLLNSVNLDLILSHLLTTEDLVVTSKGLELFYRQVLKMLPCLETLILIGVAFEVDFLSRNWPL